MNIQLRDSKPLQDFLKNGRKQMPKAQLHPELLNGIIDCDREGFDIRSEVLDGEHRGDPNPQDVANLKHFLAGPAECEAKWKIITVKQGDSLTSIANELVFHFADDSRLAIRTQAIADIAKLSNALPTDRSARYVATPGNARISFKLVGAALPQVNTLSPLAIGELKTQAAMIGVEWDEKASVETMFERMKAKREEKAAAKQVQPPKKGEKELQTV